MGNPIFIGRGDITISMEQRKVLHMAQRPARFNLVKWTHGFHGKIIPIAIRLIRTTVIRISSVGLHKAFDEGIRAIYIGGPSERIIGTKFKRLFVRRIVLNRNIPVSNVKTFIPRIGVGPKR